MKKISQYFSDNPRYSRLKKPLEAANICDAARSVAEGRFEVISFKNGLLTISCSSSSAAGNLNLESEQIRTQVNQKLGQEKVERIRIKITN